MSRPHVSIVIPIHNEEGLLEASVRTLRQQWSEDIGRTYEIILAENGSADATLDVARRLAARWPDDIRVLSLGFADYGAGLRSGALEARGEYVICEEVDLCDVGFHARALALLDSGDADLVVGSKAMTGAQDTRPLTRRAATLGLNALLRALVGFRGTDTHGLKAFRTETLRELVRSCRLRRDLFASELVIRAERQEGLRVMEIPVRIVEKRPPSIHLLRRVPGVLVGLARLTVSIRLRR